MLIKSLSPSHPLVSRVRSRNGATPPPFRGTWYETETSISLHPLREATWHLADQQTSSSVLRENVMIPVGPSISRESRGGEFGWKRIGGGREGGELCSPLRRRSLFVERATASTRGVRSVCSERSVCCENWGIVEGDIRIRGVVVRALHVARYTAFERPVATGLGYRLQRGESGNCLLRPDDLGMRKRRRGGGWFVERRRRTRSVFATNLIREIIIIIIISVREAFEGFLMRFWEIVICTMMKKLRLQFFLLKKEKSPFNRLLRYAKLNYVFYRRLKKRGKKKTMGCVITDDLTMQNFQF